jgi:hypothetical protein
MVFLNGLKQKENNGGTQFDYEFNAGSFIFNQPPAAGSRIEIYGVDGTVNAPSF